MSSRLKAQDEITAAMAEYTGVTEPKLEIYPDPAFDGVYAVRLTIPGPLEGGDPQQPHFLLTRAPRATFQLKIPEGMHPFEIEEVEFTAWPPVVSR